MHYFINFAAWDNFFENKLNLIFNAACGIVALMHGHCFEKKEIGKLGQIYRTKEKMDFILIFSAVFGL